MPTPLVHALLPAGFLKIWNIPHLPRRQWFVFLFISLFLSCAADLDLIPGVFFPEIWNKCHREWGHNLFVSFFLILLGHWAYVKFLNLETKAAWWFSSLFVLSHLFFDLFSYNIIYHDYHGVPFFWPFSDAHYFLPLPIFQSVAKRVSDPIRSQLFAKDFYIRVILQEFVVVLITWVVFALARWVTLLVGRKPLRRAEV